LENALANTGKMTMHQRLTTWHAIHQGPKPASEIFVVDDDENMRDMLEASLATEGFPVSSFADGDALLRAAGARLPLCVFLDIVMPRRSGLEVLKELRARQNWMPIYLMSARHDNPTMVEAMRSGADDYLRKPFDRHAPVMRVRAAVEAWSCREQKTRGALLRRSETEEE
jgi:two-component system, LuxR family, response regulator FixJ